MTAPVLTGLDVLVEEDCRRLAGRRLGLLVHPASVDRRLRHAVGLLHASANADLRCLFGPQHGLFGQTQDNMIEWEGFADPATGLPVYSLYGERRRPTGEQLAGIDALVVDLQDVGARYYTFVWTLLLCLEACAEHGRQVIVLDRPNPIGGVAREGNLPDPAYRSFVGLSPLPMRHGLTMGELARLLAARHAPGVDLEVVPMRGWRRAMDFEATGLPWVMPSPNLPTVDAAFVYPGFCLLEGTELSEGRGTTRPFELFGAPGIEPEGLVARLEAWKLPGCVLRPLRFEPTFQKHAGQVCGGAQVHVLDRLAFRPVLTAVAVLAAVRELQPDALRWRQPPYEYETEKLPIDVLAGGPQLREWIDEGRPPYEILSAWEGGLPAFAAEATPHQIYE